VGYNCVVLIKQVPDTTKITGEAMNDDGTVNRAALPAIFNPEDLNALELALEIKDRFGGKITAITMGLPNAATVLREALFRGADEAVLVTDRKCAASDTLATSYILSCAVKKLDHDIVLCGRQAIDGDTAQVGPQLAEKLGITPLSYVEQLNELADTTITVRQGIENGWRMVRTKLPVLLTVTEQANDPRVPAARRIMKYKKSLAAVEIEKQLKQQNPDAEPEELERQVKEKADELEKKGLLIKQWDLDFLGADLQWCGRGGSPTKVHRIQSVVLTAKDSKEINASREGISEMVHELITDKTIA
jgi:electron transfer flavoprotein beta subunit